MSRGESGDTTWEHYDEGRDEYVELAVSYRITPGCAGCYSGPPEHCYPAEGPEVEIEAVKLDGETYVLQAEEEEKLIERISENHEFDGGYDG